MEAIKKWKKTAIYFFATCCFYLLSVTNVKANNVYITNVVYTQATAKLSFTISWDNSWYTSTAPNNFDAVWVFVKYQACGVPTSPWLHANLSTASGDHSIACQSSCPGVTLQVDAVSDGKGVFIRRNASGWGNTQVWNCVLKINPAIAACPTNTSCNWKVFGIEMANIPQNSFWVGDGSGTTTNPFTNQQITSEVAITAAALGGTGTADLPAAYPKGYNTFYCMKSEITQEEYAGFLNTLQYDQQKTRTTLSPDYIYNYWVLPPTPTGGPYNRNGVKASSSGFNNYTPASYVCDLNNDNVMNGATDGNHVACNYLSWADIAAFLDWAALRPMTELEYEKVCRGTVASVADEYPWGTSTDLTAATSASISNGGGADEVSTLAPAAGLCVYNGVAGNGPLRGGASTGSATTRIQAAAAYYGMLDMAGNLWEQVISVDATGATFTGTLGDGLLDASGNADVANWPGTSGTGSGSRGGSWATTVTTYLRTSDRSSATTPAATRMSEYGGRGVR